MITTVPHSNQNRSYIDKILRWEVDETILELFRQEDQQQPGLSSLISSSFFHTYTSSQQGGNETEKKI